VTQAGNRVPGIPATQDRSDCAQCANSLQIAKLAEKVEGRGLDSRVVTYTGGAHEGDHVEQIVVTNPAAPERGEVRIGDDGSMTWEYFGKLDDAGTSKILDEATNALRATGVLLKRIRPQ
jgi:hypothetical protein